MAEYAIYNVKEEKWRDMAFRSYDALMDDFGEINRSDYECVYAFESGKELSLDDIYYIFNMARPKDFMAHSLSVSDVVETPEGFFFCDSFGWQKLDWEWWNGGI